MKLYFSPGACSLSPHIALRAAGLPFDMVKVDFATRKTADGGDYLAINPKGYVPALQLDDGSVLTEGPAIVQYIADRAPTSKLAPAAGTTERYRLMEWLNFLTSEIHKGFSPLFNSKLSEETKGMAREALARRFDYLSAQLGDNPYLMGEGFTVADGYLFTLLGWCRMTQVDLSKWPKLMAYVERVGRLPVVRAAMKAEGLIKG
ncbi:MAG: glutathione transferase GstA [Gammaproteobacteria bacterium]|nr:glutathione transferase GstA [Gammaproteobacteria bacterium]